MKLYFINGQQIIKYTSRKEAAKQIDEIKENCVWPDIDNGLYPGNSLYIEYTDVHIFVCQKVNGASAALAFQCLALPHFFGYLQSMSKFYLPFSCLF